MSKQIAAATLIETANVSDAPPRTRVDRTFGLPTALYVLTAVCYFGFFGIMTIALMEPQLAIPMSIFVFFLAMFVGVNAKWVRMDPPNPSRALGWGQFQLKGIMTHTGPVTARDATAQVLILPGLVLFWGLSVALLIALLR